MKFVKGDVIFESTGRKEYCFGEAFSPNDPGGICYGSDGGISKLMPEEIKEVADYMILQWRRWAAGEDIYPDLADVNARR